VPSLKAVLKEIGSRNRRYRKKLRVRYLPGLWPTLSLFLRIISLFSKKVSPHNHDFKRAILLTGDSPGGFVGRNLTEATEGWIRETVGIGDVSRMDKHAFNRLAESPPLVVVAYDWLQGARAHHPTGAAVKLAIRLRKTKTRAWVMLPDTYRVEVSLSASIIVAIAGGALIILQSSENDAEAYGLPHVSTKHFWTWTPSALGEWGPEIPWVERDSVALFAVTTDSYRQDVFHEMSGPISELGYRVVPTENLLTWSEYVNLNLRSKLVVTTCRLQGDFLIGPQRYRRLLPKYTVTGRVWEAFAAGAALVTDDNEILRTFGFFADEHFVGLPDPLSEKASWFLPEESELQRIAYAGHLRFIELCEASIQSHSG